jgi:hypothetical protein
MLTVVSFLLFLPPAIHYAQFDNGFGVSDLASLEIFLQGIAIFQFVADREGWS